MASCPGAERRTGLRWVPIVVLMLLFGMLPPEAASAAVATGRSQAHTREWPCRIIVQRPLLQAVERGWKHSATFRRQCTALADRKAIAILEPGAEESGFSARTRIGVSEDGVLIGRVMVPLNTETMEHIAHELEHILERAEGVDLAGESRRKGSGIWRGRYGFETQRAIDAGRQVAREVRESLRSAR